MVLGSKGILYYIRSIITIPSNHSWTCRPSRKDKSTTFGLVKVFEDTSPCRSGKCVSIYHWWLGRLTKWFWKIWESPRSSKHPKPGGGLTPFLFLPLWRNERSKKKLTGTKNIQWIQICWFNPPSNFQKWEPQVPGFPILPFGILTVSPTKHPPCGGFPQTGLGPRYGLGAEGLGDWPLGGGGGLGSWWSWIFGRRFFVGGL